MEKSIDRIEAPLFRLSQAFTSTISFVIELERRIDEGRFRAIIQP